MPKGRDLPSCATASWLPSEFLAGTSDISEVTNQASKLRLAAEKKAPVASLSQTSEEVRFHVVLFALGTALSTILWAFPLKWVWNLTLPHFFHIPQLNLWLAMGLVVLMRALQTKRLLEYVCRLLLGGRSARRDWMPAVLFPGLMDVLEWIGILPFLRLFRESARHSLWKFWRSRGEKRRRRKERWRNFNRDLRRWSRGGSFDHSRW